VDHKTEGSNTLSSLRNAF